MNQAERKEKLKKADRELIIFAMYKSLAVARSSISILLFLYSFYLVVLAKPANISLYMMLMVNALPIMIFYILKLFVRTDYQPVFVQLARDTGYNRQRFVSGMLGLVATYVFAIFLKTFALQIIIGAGLMFQIIAFLFFFIRIRNSMSIV